MKRSVWSRVDLFARQLTPFALTVFLVLLPALPWRLPEFGAVAPLLPLIAVYHWSIYRPDLMPVGAAFLVGVLQDALTGVPIGVNALVFVAIRAGVETQLRFFIGKPFGIVWVAFGLVLAAALLTTWALVAAYYGRLVVVDPVAHQFVVTLGAFPLISWLLLRWQRAFLRIA